MMDSWEEEIVIVGAGICGLATARALHRRGIKCVVVERSETLRATGSAITIFTNGWRALHQLGLSDQLRSTAIPIHSLHEISLDDDSSHKISLGEVELRCLKRGTLMESLAEGLPSDIIRYGCQVNAVKLDPQTSYPLVHLQNGTIIKAKVVIGCDGANSGVSEFLGLKPSKLLSTCSTIGFTLYPNGHGLDSESIRIRRGSVSVGRIPIDDKLVYWFVGRKWTPSDSDASKDPASIKQLAIASIKEKFPAEIIEMVESCDVNSLVLARLKYRPPWEVLLGNFSKGLVTVAGDAMHVMAPFLGQGGSAALEDAVVLARCLATRKFKAAIDQYVKERKWRLFWLSSQTYLIGLLLEPLPWLVRVVCLRILFSLFRDALGHARYDCGPL